MQAALWLVDRLADELASDSAHDRASLVEALVGHAGYEQADTSLGGRRERVRAVLVARLAGRLARD